MINKTKLYKYCNKIPWVHHLVRVKTFKEVIFGGNKFLPFFAPVILGWIFCASNKNAQFSQKIFQFFWTKTGSEKPFWFKIIPLHTLNIFHPEKNIGSRLKQLSGHTLPEIWIFMLSTLCSFLSGCSYIMGNECPVTSKIYLRNELWVLHFYCMKFNEVQFLFRFFSGISVSLWSRCICMSCE